jgi:hypothetical protein
VIAHQDRTRELTLCTSAGLNRHFLTHTGRRQSCRPGNIRINTYALQAQLLKRLKQTVIR